jgi:hypothetical protein
VCKTLVGTRGTERAENYNFFLWKGHKYHQLGIGFLVHHKIASAVKTVEFVSDRVSCIVLKSCRHNIIFLNVHARSEEKSSEPKDSFYEKLEEAFDHFCKYHKEIY